VVKDVKCEGVKVFILQVIYTCGGIMSQWTHIIGAVRFDTLALSISPEIKEKEDIVDAQIELIKESFEHSPSGSEGAVEIGVVKSKRGPIVVISGDLRDFGIEDKEGIIIWLNNSNNSLLSAAKQMTSIHGIGGMFFVRDVSISVEVEYEGIFDIIYDMEERVFKWGAEKYFSDEVD